MSDLVNLKGTKVNNIETRVVRFVIPDDSGVIVSTSDNDIDMADLESLGDARVGIIMSQGRRSVSPDSFEMLGFFKCVLQKYFIVDRMHRMRRTSGRRDENGCEFQEYVFTIPAEENCKIFGGGMIKDRVENPNMTVCVRTNSGKTIRIKRDRRQNATRIMEIVERKTLIPRDQLYLVN